MDSGNSRLSFEQMKAFRAQTKKANEDRRLEACRRRLDKIISTKIRTAFVGALAQFEDSFGFLWGHGKVKDSLTEEEQKMRDLWDQTRTSVLNNGNTQLRASQNEIANHIVTWNRHHMDLPVKPKEDNDAKESGEI
jgi:hypothetical protein